MTENRSFGAWILISISTLLVIFLLAGQTYALFDYSSAVSMGLQESEHEIGLVGIAFAKGFAFADTIIYIPLTIIGILGLLKYKAWGKYAMMGSLAISVYWPLVHLYALFIDRIAFSLSAEKELAFFIVLSIIILYGIWGMTFIYKLPQIGRNK